MDPVMEISRRARLVETLKRMRVEVNDIEALAFAAHHLTDGVVLTGDDADMDAADESVGATVSLLSIAGRQLRQLGDELDEEIELAGAMCDDDDGNDGGGGEGDGVEVPRSGESAPPPDAHRPPASPALM